MNSTISPIIDASEIVRHLHGKAAGLRIETLGTVSSTNALSRQRAIDGEAEGLVLIASSQTAGRGRKGRSFFSPDGTGLYMSLLLRPQVAPELAVRVTTLAAVSICKAIEELTGRTPGIKWVNDILMDGKKVCGILTETTLGSAAGRLDSVVLGIGVNALEPAGGFPEEISSIAGSVFPAEAGDRRAQLAAAILNHFMEDYFHIAESSFADEYRRRCIVPGRRVLVIRPDGDYEATALELDDECRLLIQRDDGSTELLCSGEISVRVRK